MSGDLGRFFQIALSRGNALGAAMVLAASLAPALVLGAQNPAPEVSTQDAQPNFRFEARRNLVLVRVVVRDPKGEAVPNLHQQDFEIFDNGKKQEIIEFSAESLASAAPKAAQPVAPPDSVPFSTAEAPTTALRYVGLFFDDLHADFEGLGRTRQAAERYLLASIGEGDRVGIFTASGQGQADFTGERDKIQEALARLEPRPIVAPESNPCPDIFPYQAYLIVERHDPNSTETAAEEILACRYQNNTAYLPQARNEVFGEASRVETRNENQNQYDFRGLEQLVKRMAILPGQRGIVVISPGFFTENNRQSISQITNRALRARVTINSLDSKGLDAPPTGGDASEKGIVLDYNPGLMGDKAMRKIESYAYDEEVLSQLASDTGGAFFHNNNDFDQGFRRLGTLPSAWYVLAFSPDELKPDGRFHNLKVKLAVAGDYSLEARRGYYAPRKEDAQGTAAHDEIEQALFSQEVLDGVPVELQTQYFMLNQQQARLSVRAHLDLRAMHFRKEQGRNLNQLTIVTALFNQDGKYLTAKEKILNFHMLDQSLERLSRDGLDARISFDVDPGTYLVREVVRDAEGGQISGLNRTVKILR